MRRSNHTDAEIVSLLKEAEAGVAIEAICASAYISTRTFYRWRKQFGGLQPDALRRLRTLELENRHLRLLVGRLKPVGTAGAWAGWAEGSGTLAIMTPPAPALPPAGRHCGTGAAAGRFASLRAGRC